MPPTLFDHRYRIDAELGRGGMGIVYRAHDTLLQRDVVVKVLARDEDPSSDSEARARLLNEARAAARLNHPNIVSIYDAVYGSGQPGEAQYIVMELVEGQSLQPGGLDGPLAALQIARQVCAALEHAHANGVIHRDLKPENVLLTASGVVKLTDFGLAHSPASHLSESGVILGTVYYLAPEQALGCELDGRADLYALGVMLYELLAGRLPFEGDNPLAVISQHLYAPPAPPSTFNPGVWPALDAFVLRLMSKRPEDRPASAAQAAQSIDELLAAARLAAAHPEAAPLSGDVASPGGALPSPLDRILRGRLVGRERELGEARALWGRAQAGEPGLLLVSGEPGVGKTRLVRELAAQAQVQRAAVLQAECYPEGSAPYAPIAGWVESAANQPGFDRARLAGLPSLAALLRLAPALQLAFPGVVPSSPSDPLNDQTRLFDGLLELCAELSARTPLLIVLEDIHWADSGTLALLRHLVRRAPRLRLRLLVVLTYRETGLEESGALAEMLHDLNRERLAARLKLGRLDRQHTGELLAAMFAGQVAPDLLESVYRETEGNPFFIEEICKALVEQGQLYRQSGSWQRLPGQEMVLPQSIKVAIQVRLARLPRPAQDTLRLAAIIGRDFDFTLLAAVSDLDEDSLLEALEQAARAQLIEETPYPSRAGALLGAAGVEHAALPRPDVPSGRLLSGRLPPGSLAAYTFTHTLIPATLADGLSGLRRQRLHQRVGEALERLYPQRLEELAPQLGRHFAAAGEWRKAIHYLLQAGDQARSVYAYQEAIRCYREGLELLTEMGLEDLEQAARVAMNLGLLYTTLFDFPSARQTFQDAFDLWDRSERASSQAALPPADSPLRLYWLGGIDTLDPTRAHSSNVITILQALFTGLVELTPALEVIPAVARSWEMFEDGRRYIFHLRSDFHWSDGVPLAAADFEFAWKRALAPGDTAVAGYLLDLKGARDYHAARSTDPAAIGVRALDDLTLQVDLEEPSGHFLYLLALWAACPLPRHVLQAGSEAWGCIDAWSPEGYVTNGPFRLAEFQPGKSLVLARNPAYPGRFPGNLARIELDLREKSKYNNLVDKYEADLHEGCPLGSPDDIRKALLDHPAEYRRAPMAQIFFLAYDVTRPPFNDRRVRQALTHGIDRQAIAETLYHGIVAPALGGVIPPGLPGHSPSIGLPFDPARARQLLAEAGYPGGSGFPSLRVWSITSQEGANAYRFLEDSWRENLGVSITFQPVDWNIYNQRLAQELPHIFTMGWVADIPDPGVLLQTLVHQPYMYWRNDEFKRLMDAARRIPDQAERVKYCQAADRLLIEDAPLAPLTYACRHYLLKPWVKSFPVSPLETYYWKYIVLDDRELK